MFRKLLACTVTLILVGCGGGGGDTATSGGSGGSSGGGSVSGGNAADYTTSFDDEESGEASFDLTSAKPTHLDPSDKVVLTEAGEVWAFVATQYAAKVYLLDQTNAQSFLNGGSFQGYLLNPKGGAAMNFLNLAAGTYWIGTVPDQTVGQGYSNSVYHEVSWAHSLPKWTFVSPNIAMSASGDAGAWKSQGFTTPTGDWRAFIETEGHGGKFALMTESQYSAFASTYAGGYNGGSYSYVYACGGTSGAADTEIECELKVASGTNYYLVWINDTNTWQGGAANIAFYRPQ